MFDIKVLTVVDASLTRLDKDIQDEAWLSSLWSLRDSFESFVRLLVACGYSSIDDSRKASRDRLIASGASLGVWVQELRSFTQLSSDETLIHALFLIRNNEACKEDWNLLFEGHDNFVFFRNQTIGHGAFAKEDSVANDVHRYTQALKKVVAITEVVLSGAKIIGVEATCPESMVKNTNFRR